MVETNIASSAVVAVTASEQQEIGRTTSTGQLAQESSARGNTMLYIDMVYLHCDLVMTPQLSLQQMFLSFDLCQHVKRKKKQ